MKARRAAIWALASTLLAAASARAEEPSAPRGELEALERALDGAVRKVSRPSAAHVLGVGVACRGYRLSGYGDVFVLAPRVLPAARRAEHPRSDVEPALEAAIAAVEEGLKSVDSVEIRDRIAKHLEALRGQAAERAASEGRLRADEAAARAQEQELRAIEAQAQVFERDAEKASQEAERAFEEVSRELRIRVAAPVPPAAPAPPAMPVPPAPEAAELAPPPLPPWRLWFDAEDDARGRTPESVVRDVRAAVTSALEAHAGVLGTLPPEEFVVVAVDFLPRGAFGTGQRPERTLVVRVRKKDLEERRTRRLPPEEFRKRVESFEY